MVTIATLLPHTTVYRENAWSLYHHYCPIGLYIGRMHGNYITIIAPYRTVWREEVKNGDCK